MKRIAVLLTVMAVLLSATSAFAAPIAAKSDHTFTATASTENLPYQCIAGTPCKVTMEFKNKTSKTVSLVNWAVSSPQKIQMDAKLAEGAPTQVEPGQTATAVMTVTFTDAAGGINVPLQCKVQYGTAIAESKIEVVVTPRFEVMMLPTRLILGPGSEPKTLGVSVINHMDKPYEGKINFIASKGITVTPSEIDGKIDALGLDAYMAKVEAKANTTPGHYTIWVSTDNMNLEWAMVDVPAVAKKTAVKADGKLEDWKSAQGVSVSQYAVGGDGSFLISKGKAMFAYDSKNLYIAINADEKLQEVQVGIDPLLDGAKTLKGALRSDDLLFKIVSSKISTNKKVVGLVSKLSGNVIEMSLPWKSLAPFKLGKNKMIAVSILVNGKYEFGGGIKGKIDPRLFVPVVLSE